MKKKKIILIITLIIILLSLLISFFFLDRKDRSKEYSVEIILNEPSVYEIEYQQEYLEYGATLMVDGIDRSNLLVIDTSNLNLEKLGSYEVSYSYTINGKKYEKIREVKVVDKIAPVITLSLSDVTILLGEKYNEPGYKAIDNYDNDITSKVKVENNVDNSKTGTYEVIYAVSDTSGNTTKKTRTVTVKKPNVVIPVVKEEKVEPPKVVYEKYTNTLTKNEYTKDGFYIEGYVKEASDKYTLKLLGEYEYNFELVPKGNEYQGEINLNGVQNGTYKVYINGQPLLNKITEIERLLRAKVNDKLVSFVYNDLDEVVIEIENHEYLYDILIDPGHGGSDPGAANAYINEKEMNLTVSLYEKCRYEAHGLRVYLTREDDTYGKGMGGKNLLNLQRRGYEMAYYGAVSHIVYSNHHNSIDNDYYSGYEILIPGYLTKEQLKVELDIVNQFNSLYPLTDNHMRFYARDYVSEVKYSKLNGEIYTFKDNYAINRIPYQISNVKSLIYENIYISNKDDFDWYWICENWYKVSEIKIKAYVEALGYTYNPDNTSCKIN